MSRIVGRYYGFTLSIFAIKSLRPFEYIELIGGYVPFNILTDNPFMLYASKA